MEVLYPQLAKVKVEVRLRSSDNWLNQLVNSSGTESDKITVKVIAAHLRKINFNEN